MTATIQEQLESLDFKVLERDGEIKAIFLPTLPPVTYHPSAETEKEGRLKDARLDLENKIAYLETEDGEKAIISILEAQGKIHFKREYEGEHDEEFFEYESDPDLAHWARSYEHCRKKDISIDYNNATNTLTVEKEGLGEVYKEQVQLPKGILIDTVAGTYLRISRDDDKEFNDSMPFVGEARSRRILVYASYHEPHVSDSIEEAKAFFIYALGPMSGGFFSLQEFVNQLVPSSTYQEDLTPDQKFQRTFELGYQAQYALNIGDKRTALFKANEALTINPNYHVAKDILNTLNPGRAEDEMEG